MTEERKIEFMFLLSRLDEEAGLSDDEILDESRQNRETPAIVAIVIRKIMTEALATNQSRLRSENQLSVQQRLRPLLLLTLSRLASIGIACSLSDGIRLIRDFLRGEWPNVGRGPSEPDDVICSFLSFAHKTACLQLT